MSNQYTKLKHIKHQKDNVKNEYVYVINLYYITTLRNPNLEMNFKFETSRLDCNKKTAMLFVGKGKIFAPQSENVQITLFLTNLHL